MDGEHLRALGRIEGKVDLVLKSLSSHDKRITAVERKIWWVTGAWAMLSVVAAKLGLSSLFGSES